jgi:hypothetical protein
MPLLFAARTYRYLGVLYLASAKVSVGGATVLSLLISLRDGVQQRDEIVESFQLYVAEISH